MSKKPLSKRIEDILLEKGQVNSDQINEARANHEVYGGTLAQAMVRLGFLNESDIVSALTSCCGFPYLPVDNYEIDMCTIRLIPENKARQHCMVPIEKIAGTLTVAMSDPLDAQAIDELEFLTKCSIQPFVSMHSEIEKAIAHYYHPKRQMKSAPHETSKIERRVSPRIKNRLPILLRNHLKSYRTQTMDLSVSGLLCDLSESLLPRTIVNVQIQLSRDNLIQGQAVVVRAEVSKKGSKHQHGLSFHDFTYSDRLMLSQFIDQERISSGKDNGGNGKDD